MSLKPPVGPNTPLGTGRVFYNVQSDFGARGDGTTDDTAAFNAALAAGGYGSTIFAPPGTYLLSDVAFPADGITIRGTGNRYNNVGTTFKTAPGASYAIRNERRRYNAIRNVTFDGSASGSRTLNGLLYAATAAGSAQQMELDRVMFYRCLVGLEIGPGAGGVTQADKVLALSPTFVECAVGIQNEATNGQNVVVLNGSWETTYDACVRMSAGTLRLIGGQFQVDTGSGTIYGIDITGPNVDYIALEDFISEGPTIDINFGYKVRDGIYLNQVALQGGLRSGANILIPNTNTEAKILAQLSRFNDGALGTVGGGLITVNSTNAKIELKECTYGVPVINGTQVAAARVFRAGPTSATTDLSQAGLMAPQGLTPAATSAVTASRAYLGRVVPPRDMTITTIAFAVAVAAGSDDPVDVGLYDSSMVRLVSSGATTGKLNGTGVKTIAVTATKLLAGQVYYVAIAPGAIGTTAAQLVSVNLSSAFGMALFGSVNPQALALAAATSHPLPNPITGVFVTTANMATAARES